MSKIIRTYKCLNCGAPAEFDDNENKIKCPYCDTVLLLLKDKNSLQLAKAEKDSLQLTEVKPAQENEQVETRAISMQLVSKIKGSILPDAERIYVPLESNMVITDMPQKEENQPVNHNHPSNGWYAQGL